jgi:hypothetical protein
MRLFGRQFLDHRMFDFPTGFFFLICKKKLVICDELRTHFFVCILFFVCEKCVIEKWKWLLSVVMQ